MYIDMNNLNQGKFKTKPMLYEVFVFIRDRLQL